MDQLLNHWRLHDTYNVFKKDERHQRPVTLRKRRQRIQCTDNWRLFFYEFARDHSRCDLIWNHKTREELREAIDTELRLLAMDVELASGHQGKVKHTSDSTGATAAPPTVPVSWNHVEFEVAYPSLADEVRIGDYFLRNLLDEDTEENNKSATLIHQPLIFFNDVYHHYLLTTKVDMRCLCLRAMAITYARHAVDIGQFNDLPHLCKSSMGELF
jgi:DnaJ family protein C protein 13